MTRCVAAQALFDLEATNAELKSDLRDLYITKAEEIDGKSGRKAIIIHVRLGLLKALLQRGQENSHTSRTRPCGWPGGAG